MAVPWFERIHVHEQQKAPLHEQEAKLNGAERKARTAS
jgi:hypothetical protein